MQLIVDESQIDPKTPFEHTQLIHYQRLSRKVDDMLMEVDMKSDSDVQFFHAYIILEGLRDAPANEQ